MAKEENELLKLIYERLCSIDPLVKKIAVEPKEPGINISFVELQNICYMTSKSDSERNETVLVSDKEERFFTNLPLAKLEEKLVGNPHFFRTSKYYIVNLAKIRGLRMANARDLFFEGIKEPVLNGVTGTYLEEFEKRFK